MANKKKTSNKKRTQTSPANISTSDNTNAPTNIKTSQKSKKETLTQEGKNEKKQEGELPPKKTISTENKQLIGFAIVIVIFFAAFLGPYFYVQNQKTFEYAGTTWQIETDGPLTFYHTQFGKFYKGQYLGAHNTFLRNNPRTNSIPIEIGKLSFDNHLIIAQSPEVLKCDKQILVTDALYQISQALPFIKEKTIAITDEATAKEINRDYATCTNKPSGSTVIQVEFGDESKITEDPENDCYEITIEKCEDNLITAEKFILEIIRQINEQ